jgi:hypothetical protein
MIKLKSEFELEIRLINNQIRRVKIRATNCTHKDVNGSQVLYTIHGLDGQIQYKLEEISQYSLACIDKEVNIRFNKSKEESHEQIS